MYVRTLVYSAVLWLTLIGWMPHVLAGWERGLGITPFQFWGQPWVAGVLFAASAALNLSAGYTMTRWGRGTPLPMDCANELVVRGVYRFVRNPMAIGGLGLAFAVGVGLGSLFVLLYAVVGGVVWDRWVRPSEEADLQRRFGEAYAEYCGRVRCWWPVWPKHSKASGAGR